MGDGVDELACSSEKSISLVAAKYRYISLTLKCKASQLELSTFYDRIGPEYLTKLLLDIL